MRRAGITTDHGNGLFAYVRAFGWQLDYRQGGWLPKFADDWHILRLGPLGCITLGKAPAQVVLSERDREES